MDQKRAIITGVSGQDGAYLSKLLIEKGYKVFGTTRRASTLNLQRLNHFDLIGKVDLVTLEATDFANILQMINEIQPAEIYHLGGQTSVHASFRQPMYTAETVGVSILNFMHACNLVCPNVRFFHAASSEIFGVNTIGPVDEAQAFRPRSPYGVAKLFAYWSLLNFREANGLHASNGILFNHESPVRGMDFVTRKITTTLAQIACGEPTVLRLGNLDNARDWGFAGDYVEAMWAMLQQDRPDDYVIASGETHTVREFVELAAQALGIDMVLEFEGLDTVGFDRTTGRKYLEISADFYRPSEPDAMAGNAQKARKVLGWKPRVTFEQLVTMMAEHDLQLARDGRVWF